MMIGDDGRPYWSVLFLVPADRRRSPGEANSNYGCCMMDKHGNVEALTFRENIVEITAAYADDYGMDT